MNDAGTNCFIENRNLFSNAKETPEKFNLYNGLVHLSSAVVDLTLKVDSMEKEMQDLKHRLHKHNMIE